MTHVQTPEGPGGSRLEAVLAMLRAMRLRGMAEDLPGLLEEGVTQGWSQIDLLWELAHREQTRKRQRRYQRDLKASQLSECYGLEHYNFELGREHGIEPSLVRDLCQCEFIRGRRNLIFAGGVGTGKTFLARTVGMEALKRGYRVYSFYTADLLELFHKKRNSFHFGRVYARIRDVELLVLDDLAYLPYAPEKVEYLFTLIVDRHELRSGSTIVTSNTDVTDWWQFFPSKAMGMAFSDRLLEGAQGIRFSGESIRAPRGRRPDPPPQPSTN